MIYFCHTGMKIGVSMQYLVIAYNHDNALEKRLAAREDHLSIAKDLISKGKIINAGALIED